MLLSGYFVPLALTMLAAELYNILAFHLTLAPATIAPALLASVLWVLVFLQYRESFNGIFTAKPATQTKIASQDRRPTQARFWLEWGCSASII